MTSVEGALKTTYNCEDAMARQFQECTGWSGGRSGSKPSTFPRCSALVPIFTAALAASTHAFEELDSDREEAQILPCSVPYSLLMRSDNLICNRGLSYRSDHTILAGR